jgi:hypothetical protein
MAAPAAGGDMRLRPASTANGPAQTAAAYDLRHFVVLVADEFPAEQVLPHADGTTAAGRLFM